MMRFTPLLRTQTMVTKTARGFAASGNQDVIEKFQQTTSVAGPKVLSLNDNALKLKFYALYKQATEADVKGGAYE